MNSTFALDAARPEEEATVSRRELERRRWRTRDDDPARHIVRATAEVFEVSSAAIVSPRRGNRQVGWARKVAMYLVREELKWSWSHCARFFRREPSNVITACKSVAVQIRADGMLARDVDWIRELRHEVANRKKSPRPQLVKLCGEGAPGEKKSLVPVINVVLPRVALVVAGDFNDAAAVEGYLESLPAGATIVTMQLQIAHWASEFPLHVIHVMGRGEGEDDTHERQMLEYADCLVVFWGESGWGTHRAIELAQELGKKFVVLERAKD